MIGYRKLGEYVEGGALPAFRIRMASGYTFRIRHPEMILVEPDLREGLRDRDRPEPKMA